MSVFFNDEPALFQQMFIPPLRSSISVLGDRAHQIVSVHTEYGIVGGAMTVEDLLCNTWVRGSVLGDLGAIFALAATFARCLREAEEPTDAQRVEKLFMSVLDTLRSGGTLDKGRDKAFEQGLLVEPDDDMTHVYTYVASIGKVPRVIRTYVSLMRRAGETGPQGPFPALEGLSGACDGTGENWICSASADLQTIAIMLLSAIHTMSLELKKMRKRKPREFVRAVLLKPVKSVWNGLPVHEALRAVREGTK